MCPLRGSARSEPVHDPVTGAGAGTGTIEGQAIVKVDWNELAAIKELFRADTLSSYDTKVQTIG
jgi:hypothetical protein